MSKIAFIGAGNMAEALIKGLITSGVYKSGDIIAADVLKKRLDHLSSEYRIKISDKNDKAAKQADIIVLSVKPHHVLDVLEEINSELTPSKIVITIAAGISIPAISQVLENKTKIIRVMPNTPALVLAGASVLYCNENVNSNERRRVKKIFESIGIAYIVEDEALLDPATGLSGSGPAFVSIFIEALSDGGVKMGLPRDMAHKLAAQTVYGTAKMIIESDTHPAQFKDKVSSPGGTTIEGIHRLEEGGFRSSTISAVEAATRRSKELSKGDK
ncbi:MAG: pyrroline-5-carboxylate reductase [Deltaproteobacteria bacterium]|nr:pyrroline-5-carboxylate reductase [Deltaproteobacteria bacterium]MCK5709816.1 pyrroline-5-carboxylate reductase [Deltaproteobacteria bacterium]